MQTSQQKKRNFRWFLSSVFLVVLLIISALISLSVGEIDIPFLKILGILQENSSIEHAVITNIRLPRTLLAFSIGGALSLAGTLLQGVYRNPLVDPYTLGISGGAALGVSICIVLGVHLNTTALMLPLFGFVGAFGAIFLVYTLSMRSKKDLNLNKTLLIGVMISYISSSAMLLCMAISSAEDLQSIVFWVMGSLNEPNETLIKLSIVTSILGLLASYFYVVPLNAMRLGEVKAKHLGIDTQGATKAVFLIASIITGISVSVAGVIGFVGLVIPHIMRNLIGSDYRILLVSSFLGGGIFLIFSDILARTAISPNELPIGVITGMVGGTIFIVALSKKMKRN